MYAILILSHGELANAFLNTSKLIMGEQVNIIALGLEASESREDYQVRLVEACESLDHQDGILVLTDLYGGTPSNAAILSLFGVYPNLQMVTGINLAMVIEALTLRTSKSLNESVEFLKETGCQGIVDVRAMLAEQE